MRGASGLLPLLLAALASRIPAQIGGEITGFSAVSAGRGGAGGARGDSVLDSLRNPATLASLLRRGEARKGEADLRLAWTPFSGVSEDGQSFRNEDAFGAGPFLGFGAALDEDWVFGVTLVPTLAAGMRMHRQTRLQVDDAGTPRFRDTVIDQNILQIGLTPAVAWRRGAWAFGASLSLRHTRLGLQGPNEISTLETFQGDSGLGGTWGEVLSGFPFFIDDIQVEYDGDAVGELSAVLHLGATVELRPDTVLGFWYRSPSTATDLEGEVTVDLRPELGPILDFFGLSSLSEYDVLIRNVRFPQQLGLAFSHEATDRDRLFLDLVWTDWSQTFDGFTAVLQNPSNGDFADLVGGDGSTDIDLGIAWQDVFSFALGYERDLDPRWTLRGGVGWAGNTVTGDVAPGTHILNQWALSAGASLWGETGNWHLAVVAALPTTYAAGSNSQVSDFSFDRYRQAIYQVVLAWETDF